MANSQTMNTSNEYIKYYIECTQQSQNVANNTSKVYIRVVAYRTNTGYTTYGNGTCYCKINGTTYSSTITNDHKITNLGCELFTITLDIGHNADGTKTLDMSAWISHSRFSSSEQAWSMGLTTIPRATTPTLSASSTAMGSSVTINTPRASSSFTHTLTYKFGSASGTIATGVTTSKAWTIPLDLAKQIPNATSGSGTITCTTYNGSTKIGDKSVNFTATVPSSVVPTISTIALSDPTGNATTFGAYVQSKSTLKVQVTSAGAYSSTIKTVSITALGTTVTSNPWTSNAITVGAGSQTVSVKVTDSRGRTATKTATFTVIGYASPTITKLTGSRCAEDGSADDSGAFMKISYAATITTLNNKNSKSVIVKYKAQNSSTWIEAVNQQVYSIDSSVIVPADINQTYDVNFYVADYYTSTQKNWQVSTAFTLMDFKSTGHGMAVGKVSELEDTLEIAEDWTLKAGSISANNIRSTASFFGNIVPTGHMSDWTWTSYDQFANMINDLINRGDGIRFCVMRGKLNISGANGNWSTFLCMTQNTYGNGTYDMSCVVIQVILTTGEIKRGVSVGGKTKGNISFTWTTLHS